jgi:hypothetical protein
VLGGAYDYTPRDILTVLVISKIFTTKPNLKTDTIIDKPNYSGDGLNSIKDWELDLAMKALGCRSLKTD